MSLFAARVVLILTTPLYAVVYLFGGLLAGLTQGVLALRRDLIEAWRQRRMGLF